MLNISFGVLARKESFYHIQFQTSPTHLLITQLIDEEIAQTANIDLQQDGNKTIYRLAKDHQTKNYREVKPILTIKDTSKTHIGICKFAEKLVVVKQMKLTGIGKQCFVWVKSDKSVNEILSQAMLEENANDQKINKILNHPDFAFQEFMEYALEEDGSGIMRLLYFSADMIGLLLQKGFESKINIPIEPLRMIHPISKQNLFIHAAHAGALELMFSLIEYFPKSFKSAGQEMVEIYLQNEGSPQECSKMINKLQDLDGIDKIWGSLMLKVALRQKPEEGFDSKLNSNQKKIIFDIAYSHDNPFVYEPLDYPIAADCYSVNFMWINSKRIPDNQEFLFDFLTTPTGKQVNFQDGFVEPIAQWALVNGCSMNIWYDSQVATVEAIQRSERALQQKLQDFSKATINFRDVRSIECVNQYKETFSEKVSVYFRVDLLRAIAADYTLRRGETKFFVYADLDLKAYSAKEIFDTRTFAFLDNFGIVMAKSNASFSGYENGFQILNGNHQICMDLHKMMIIESNYEIGKDKLCNQTIYHSYEKMLDRQWSKEISWVKTEQNKWRLSKMPTKYVALPDTRFK